MRIIRAGSANRPKSSRSPSCRAISYVSRNTCDVIIRRTYYLSSPDERSPAGAAIMLGMRALEAWSSPFQRIRRDLDDALRREAAIGAGSRTPEQRQYLVDALTQFWDATDRIFALARDGHEADARAEIRLSLQARQAALGAAVARLLVGNNESEEDTAARVQGIYDQVERQV